MSEFGNIVVVTDNAGFTGALRQALKPLWATYMLSRCEGQTMAIHAEHADLVLFERSDGATLRCARELRSQMGLGCPLLVRMVWSRCTNAGPRTFDVVLARPIGVRQVARVVLEQIRRRRFPQARPLLVKRVRWQPACGIPSK